MKLSIIIPVFNEDKTIEEILKKVNEVNLNNIEKEIIVVNDGSSDETSLRLEKIKKQFKNIKIFKHKLNQGKGAAVITGIKNSTGDYVIIQDADLEYDPKYISILLNPIINKTAEVVFGTRLKRLPHIFKEENKLLFLIHFIGNRFLSLITSVIYGQWLTDMETCYKLFPLKIAKTLVLHARGFEFEPEITAKLIKSGMKILEVPILTTPRGYKEGKKLNTVRDGVKAICALLWYRIVD